MKPITVALKAHYALGATTLVTCLKATLTNGTVLMATAHDQNIEYPAGSGDTYLATASYNPSEVVNSADLSVDNLEIEGFLASPLITEADIYSGVWDYAAIEIFVVNYKDLSPTMGRDLVRKGTLGEVRAGRSQFNAELRSLFQKLSKHIVKVTTKECTHDLGDAECQINLALYTIYGTITAVTSWNLFTDSARTEVSNWFTGGLLTWITGLNAGLSMEVRRSTSTGVIELQESMPFAVQVGDTYSMYAGCTKRFTEDCIGKFNNYLNFGGFPYLPLSDMYNGPGTAGATTPGTTPGAPTPAPTPAPTVSPMPAPTSPPITDGSWGTDALMPLSIVSDRWLSVGDVTEYYLADNPWGAAGLTRGVYTTSTGTTYESGLGWSYTYGANGEISWRMAWKWPDGTSEVKSYPSALIGNKPGYYNSWTTPGGFPIELPEGTYDTRYPSGKTHNGNFFPLAANGALPTINAAVGSINHLVTPSGAGHLSYDIWLQSSSAQINGFSAPPISHEIMIPLDLWGHYGEYGYRNPGWYSHDETIQGILFHIYFVRVFNGAWTFVVFEPDIAALPITGTLNLAEFLNKLTTMNGPDALPMASGSEYLVSVELGVEPNVGIGDLEVLNYRVWKP